MKKNPLLKAKSLIMKKVYNNTLTIVFCENTKTYDDSTGKIHSEKMQFERIIKCSNPKSFTEAIIDGEKYAMTDLSIEIAFLDLAECIRMEHEDGGHLILHSVMDLAGKSYGLDKENDCIFFRKRKYRIKEIKPLLTFADTSAALKLHLREI